MLAKEDVEEYSRILTRVVPEEKSFIQEEIGVLKKCVGNESTTTLEPISSVSHTIINLFLKNTENKLHRFPADWEIRGFLRSTGFRKGTNKEAREAINEILKRHTNNIKKVPEQDYVKHHREDVELLFMKLVELNSEQELMLKDSLDRQFKSNEFDGVLLHKGIFDSFSGTYAFNFKLPLNDHPIYFDLALRSLVSTYLPETDERLLWRQPISETLCSETKATVAELVRKYTS